MRTTEAITFPKLELRNSSGSRSVSMVGLTHVVLQKDAEVYHEVAEYVAGRLALPGSVVHYEGLIHSSPQEVAAANQSVRQKHSLLAKTILCEKELIDTLGLASQGQHLITPFKNERWFNHDLTTLQVADRLSYTGIALHAKDWEAELLDVKSLNGAQKEAYLRDYYLAIEEALQSGPDKTWEAIDLRREDIAVRAATVALGAEVQHVTMLWGEAHLSSFQQKFAAHGYYPHP